MGRPLTLEGESPLTIEKKGILTTLRALAEVVETWPELSYVLCGDGPGREKIEAEVERLGLGKNVELRGWTAQEELREEFERAHLFLHPSELSQLLLLGELIVILVYPIQSKVLYLDYWLFQL